MHVLTEADKRELIRRITAGETLPASWQYGNEKMLLLGKGDFAGKRRR